MGDSEKNPQIDQQILEQALRLADELGDGEPLSDQIAKPKNEPELDPLWESRAFRMRMGGINFTESN